MIIKLTEVLDGDAERVLYVNVAHIESMWIVESNVTRILMASGSCSHWVRETPEQIINM